MRKGKNEKIRKGESMRSPLRTEKEAEKAELS